MPFTTDQQKKFVIQEYVYKLLPQEYQEQYHTNFEQIHIPIGECAVFNSNNLATLRTRAQSIAKTVIAAMENKNLLETIQIMLVQMQSQQEELKALRDSTIDQHINVKPVQPDTFSGTRSTATVEAWLHMVEKYLDCTSLNDKGKVSYASSLLRSGAATWWHHLETTTDPDDSISNRTLKTWQDFKTAFRQEFKPHNSQDIACNKLMKLHQNTTSSGTIRKYIVAFRDIMLELPEMGVGEAIHYFIRGLTYEACMQVSMQRPVTLVDAYNAAESYESVQEYARGIRDTVQDYTSTTHSHTPHSATHHEGPTPMDLDAMQTCFSRDRPTNQCQWRPSTGYHGQRRADTAPHLGPNRLSNKRCFNCGGVGHIA